MNSPRNPKQYSPNPAATLRTSGLPVELEKIFAIPSLEEAGLCIIKTQLNAVASVAKWLRQWIVVPPFEGSSPFVRPF